MIAAALDENSEHGGCLIRRLTTGTWPHRRRHPRLPRPGRVGLAGHWASLNTAGLRHDVDEAVIGRVFADWRIERMERTAVPSDTRMLDVLLARLIAPSGS